MQIEFDSSKDDSNLAGHGISLVLAADLDWDSALIWQYTCREYDEVRMAALAPHARPSTSWPVSTTALLAASSACAAPTPGVHSI